MRQITILVLLSLFAACSHSSTSARIRRLSAQEQELRTSVQTLSARQEALRAEVMRSQVAADAARCDAKRETYRAVVATLFAEYSTRVAEHKGCAARAAKGGGAVMAVGCGVAAFLTGGAALALCGGAFVAGALISEGSCGGEPSEMTAEDIRARAEEQTGMAREPTCTGKAIAVGDDIWGGGVLPSPRGSKRSRSTGPRIESRASQQPEGLRKLTRKDIRRHKAAERDQAKAHRKALKKAEREHWGPP